MAIVKLSSSKFKVNLGFLSIETEWQIDELQRNASWEMYVELVTRITTIDLKENEGVLREAMTSLYSLFSTTRTILKKYGPTIAKGSTKGDLTFGHLSVAVLNNVIRPFLTKWHPMLKDFEELQGSASREVDWKYNHECRDELSVIKKRLTEYAIVLGEVSGVDDLTNIKI